MRIWHCETQEQYDYLMEQLEAEGRHRWGMAADPTNLNVWSSYRSETCVEASGNDLRFGAISHYKHHCPDVEIESVVIPE